MITRKNETITITGSERVNKLIRNKRRYVRHVLVNEIRRERRKPETALYRSRLCQLFTSLILVKCSLVKHARLTHKDPSDR